MSAELLKKWMEGNDKTVQDIAYVLQIHPQTVYRYLAGKPVHRGTKASLERLVSGTQQQAPPKAAAG